MTRREALRRLLRPESVAVIGGDSAAEVIRQCRAIEFPGEIWAVNPYRSDLAGIPCVPGVADMPGTPDASFVAAPPGASLDIVAELAQRGAPGAVCFAAGFAETGTEGAGLQRQLCAAAGEMVVMGPNCHGFINYLDGVALWPDQHGSRRCERGVALITQSGNIGINLTMQRRGIDFAYVISAGNNSALGMHDYLGAMLDDPRVTAIGLHIEGLVDVPAFSETALEALRRGIPIAVLKAGRSARGAEITLSHTGSLAGSDELYSAFFARHGIARCETVSQFLEAMKFLSTVGALPARTLGSMSCSGGDASIVADNADALALQTPPFSDASAARLAELLGPNVAIANPLDYHLYVWGDQDKLTTCFSEVLGNGYACCVLVLDYPPGDKDDAIWQVAERALIAAVRATGQKAVVVSSLPETLPRAARERLKAAGLAPMQGIEDCLFAIRAAAAIGETHAAAAALLPVLANAVMGDETTLLDERASKQLLAESGVQVPAGLLSERTDLVDAANAIGYPVVLKAVADGLAHKTEAGAVVVGIASDAELRAAIEAMPTGFEHFLVEEHVANPVAELIVGATRDPIFGLVLLIGTGGIHVELLRDTVSLLLPVKRAEIETAIRSIKAGALIDAYRGGPGADFDKVVDAVLTIAGFVTANAGTLIELDVNPLLVTANNAVAVDALIRTSR